MHTGISGFVREKRSLYGFSALVNSLGCLRKKVGVNKAMLECKIIL